MKIAVIEVGVMGEPIARNLKTAGFSVTVYCRTKERAALLLAAGLLVVRAATEALDSSDVVILMVPGHEEIDQAPQVPPEVARYMRGA